MNGFANLYSSDYHLAYYTVFGSFDSSSTTLLDSYPFQFKLHPEPSFSERLPDHFLPGV